MPFQTVVNVCGSNLPDSGKINKTKKEIAKVISKKKKFEIL